MWPRRSGVCGVLAISGHIPPQKAHKRPPKYLPNEHKMVPWDPLGTLLNKVSLTVPNYCDLWNILGALWAPLGVKKSVKMSKNKPWIHAPKIIGKSEILDHPQTSETWFSLQRGCYFHYSGEPRKRYHKNSKIPPKRLPNGAMWTQSRLQKAHPKHTRKKDTKRETNKPVLAREREARFKDNSFRSNTPMVPSTVKECNKLLLRTASIRFASLAAAMATHFIRLTATSQT